VINKYEGVENKQIEENRRKIILKINAD